MSRNELCAGDWQAARPLPVFSPRVTAFLSDVSAGLLQDPAARAYPDIITFAFFCRAAHLKQLQAAYDDSAERMGRGMAFHIAPSNVPINFAYSLVAGLLAGNACVVKASSRDFVQTRLVCAAMNRLLSAGYADLAPYVTVLTYPREDQAQTESLSAACDARIIWGGDETVRRVRQAPLPQHAVEIAFADRYSLLVANAQAVLAMDQAAMKRLAQDFYNDTYLTDQNACTAPRLVYWLGTAADASAARERFWGAVHAYAQPRYPIQPVAAVDKLTAACRAAIDLGAVQQPMPDNVAVRVRLPQLTPDMDTYRCPSGYFVEFTAESLEPLARVIKRKYQTLSYTGMDPAFLQRWIIEQGLAGIDRIVPVGHTLDFDLIWDGYDLIRTLSRRITAR